MHKVFNYIIFDELNLILEFYQGDILLNDFISLAKELAEDKQYNPCYNVIIDVRKADLKVSDEDMKKYLDFAGETDILNYERMTAVVTNTPSQVVTTVSYASHYEDTQVKYKIFSTIEGAIVWLKLPIENTILIEEQINGLRR